MSPKRPPVPLARQPVTDWDPTDTQTLERKVHLAQETAWRVSTVDQFTKLGVTLVEVRDCALKSETLLESKSSKAELAALQGQVAVVANSIFWLRIITVGVLLAVALDIVVALRRGGR